VPAGWVLSSVTKNGGAFTNGGDIVLTCGQTATIVYNDTELGTIVLVKNSSGGDGTFSFNLSVLTPSPKSITTSGGTGQFTWFNLDPGAGYGTIADVAQSGWIRTGLTFTSALGTSTVSVDAGTGIATISNLACGDTVTVTYENTAVLTTRTQGFWATHIALIDEMIDHGTINGQPIAGTLNLNLCGEQLGNATLMGGFWANISKTTNATNYCKNHGRGDLGQARMQLLQQLLAAMLNNAAFGSSPSGPISIDAAKTAFCSGTLAQVKAAAAAMGSFNESGDSGLFTPGVNANPKLAKSIADIAHWDTIVGGKCPGK